MASNSSAVGRSGWNNGAVLAKVLPAAVAAAVVESMAGDKPSQGNHNEERLHDENALVFTLN